MDAPPGTIPNLLHWLICFADLTTFENNAEVSVALKEEDVSVSCAGVCFLKQKKWPHFHIPLAPVKHIRRDF